MRCPKVEAQVCVMAMVEEILQREPIIFHSDVLNLQNAYISLNGSLDLNVSDFHRQKVLSLLNKIEKLSVF